VWRGWLHLLLNSSETIGHNLHLPYRPSLCIRSHNFISTTSLFAPASFMSASPNTSSKARIIAECFKEYAGSFFILCSTAMSVGAAIYSPGVLGTNILFLILSPLTAYTLISLEPPRRRLVLFTAFGLMVSLLTAFYITNYTCLAFCYSNHPVPYKDMSTFTQDEYKQLMCMRVCTTPLFSKDTVIHVSAPLTPTRPPPQRMLLFSFTACQQCLLSKKFCLLTMRPSRRACAVAE